MSWILKFAAPGNLCDRRCGASTRQKPPRRVFSGLNPTIEIETFETRLTSENALELFRDFDIIVDGTD